jgi:hypothetical protein
VIPAIGAVLFAAAWYGSVYPAPYVVAVWLLAGLGMLAYLSNKRPEAIERIGSILGEEGGTLVEALDEK